MIEPAMCIRAVATPPGFIRAGERQLLKQWEEQNGKRDPCTGDTLPATVGSDIATDSGRVD